MSDLLRNLKSLGRTRLMILGGVGLGIVLATFLGLSAIMAPRYQVLFTGLSPSAASSIVSTLEQSGFRTQISADSAVVRVPEADLARARMVVAEAGLAQEGAPGYELFDETSGLGMNSFAQNITRLRALEGELARSIQTLDTVESARVHVVLPEREAFSRQAPEPSASVVVRTASGGDMTRSEALAIRSLVAAAVPRLDPGSVTVVSASGRVILAENDGTRIDAGVGSRQAELEDRIARNIESMLAARVGAGNARVRVSATLSGARRITVEESYDPDQQVERSVEMVEESSEDRNGNAGGVGVAGNLPGGLDGGEGDGGSAESSTSTRERTEFEIGSTRSETVREPGEVERLSVAVLVNGIYEAGGEGAPAYTDRSEEEIARLEQLVKSAVGFDAERGDTVSIESMRFMDYSMALGDEMAPSFTRALAEQVPMILRLVFALLLFAVAMFFITGPARRMFFGQTPELANAAGEAAALESQAEEAQPVTGTAVAIAGGSEPGAAPAPFKDVSETWGAAQEEITDPAREGEVVRISAIDSVITRDLLEAARSATDADLDAAVSVLRGWMSRKVAT